MDILKTNIKMKTLDQKKRKLNPAISKTQLNKRRAELKN